jgi:putative sterol carrier protein
MNTATFPSPEWMQAIKEKLNTDEHYAQVARNWEGDMRIILEPDKAIQQGYWLYLDLWHGKCREAFLEDQSSSIKPAFVLSGSYNNIIKILSGEVGIVQALMTRMVGVQGSMATLMRNVPTVLDFVRCCQEVTQSWIEPAQD